MWKPKRQASDWRKNLTPDEASDVRFLERQIADYRAKCKKLTDDLSPIRNRAIARRRTLSQGCE